MRLMTANLTLACTALVAAMTTFGAQAQTAPGSTLEKNFRMAMVEKSGSFSVFLDKPIALFFIALAALLVPHLGAA